MKTTKEKIFAELSKQRPSKINLSLSDNANKMMDDLYEFRVKVGELFQDQNTVYDEAERVNQMWRNLAERGEGILTEYYSLKDAAGRVLLDAEEKISELGISPSDIPYYEELKNNINDTEEDEDGLVNGLRDWQDLSDR
jgi:hypothetical protein